MPKKKPTADENRAARMTALAVMTASKPASRRK